MPTVELIYDRQCPNVTQARANLLEAFAEVQLPARWSEHLIEEAPAHARGYGSPTILVDGQDVAGASPGEESSCRLYEAAGGGVTGVPQVSQIAAALRRAQAADRGGWRLSLAVLPGIGAAMLPKLACPACWPAYAGFLSSLGLPFLIESAWLLPLTAAFLLVANAALAFRARTRRGYGPLGAGIAASAVVLLGKFAFDSDVAMYAGLGLLVAASLWNSWPRRRLEACPSCVPSK
ncbi:MAG: MerC family mercury resistance protein [Myxococcales bacterium]|nr:MerC family mercury resistance protein [Myxococcales bacterium]